MAQQEDRYLKELGKMRRPIPGSSLTNNPESPLPFEGPPIFTNKKEAIEEVFTNMIRPDVYPQMMEAVSQGSTVMEISQVILFEGFREGKWNPDMFLMLVEPTAYMIMGLAERAGIEYQIDNEEEQPSQASEVDRQFNMLADKLGKSKLKTGVLPKEIEKQIEELPAESLLSPPKRSRIQDTDFAQESLLTPPQEEMVEE